MKPENRPKIKFEGREYDDYQATQKQRQIERTIRKQRRLKASYEAAGLTEDAAAAGSRLKILNQKYREFSKAAGLPEQRERMKVAYVDDASKAEAAKSLEKRAKFGILNDTEYKGIPITEEAIQRVPQVRPDGWSVERAERLQEAHRDLLRSVMDKPVGTEAGAIYSPDMQLIERKVGDAAAQRISLPKYDEPHVLIHNHPSGFTFSKEDINSFGLRADTVIMTAVGNSGSVYLLQKTKEYDPIGFAVAFGKNLLPKLDKAKSAADYAAAINSFLKEAKKYGVQFIT